MSEYQKVRRLIIEMEKPFYLYELVNYVLEKKVTEDKRIIFRALNDLYDEGLILYREEEGVVEDPLNPPYKYVFVA